MDPYLIRLPDIGEGVAEAEIIAWHVGVGDWIEEDQATVDVMTDKVTVQMTAPVSGMVVALHGTIGEMVAVGSPLIELSLGEDATSVDALDGPETPTLPETVAEHAPEASPSCDAAATSRDPAPVAEPKAHEAPLAAPATRRRASELGIDLRAVRGTGPDGRVTSDDLEAFRARGRGPATPASGVRRTRINETAIVGLRRKIAEKMQDAKRRIPHFGYVEEFDLSALEALRGELNADRSVDQPKLTLLPFFMRAVAQLVPQFPQVNARYDDEAGILRSFEGVHIGIATQTAGGLLVPVVRHAEALDLWQCARELGRVSQAARDGSAGRDELTGSTITLTSLGALGGVSATPVINHPEVAIIGPNKLVERPMVIKGQVVVRTMMNVSSSFDHRIIDGYDAARFVQALRRLIENPALLFVERG